MAVVCPEVGSLNCEVFHVHIYVRLLEDVTDVTQYDVDCLQPKTHKATRFLCSIWCKCSPGHSAFKTCLFKY